MPKNFFGMRMKILRYDQVDVDAKVAAGTIATYLKDEANYGIVPFKDK